MIAPAHLAGDADTLAALLRLQAAARAADVSLSLWVFTAIAALQERVGGACRGYELVKRPEPAPTPAPDRRPIAACVAIPPTGESATALASRLCAAGIDAWAADDDGRFAVFVSARSWGYIQTDGSVVQP